MADTLRVTQVGLTIVVVTALPATLVSQAGATVTAEVIAPTTSVSQAGATAVAEVAAPATLVSQVGATVAVVPLVGIFSEFGGGSQVVILEGFGSSRQTLYARRAYGMEGFEWAGQATTLARVVRDSGALAPTLIAGAGSLQVSGATSGAPGVVETMVTFKESTVRSMGDWLMACTWDLDRRACYNPAHWDGWKVILRVARGRAINIVHAPTATTGDAATALATVAWRATDICTIRRVSLSTWSTGT